MPTYDYTCKFCDEDVEIFHSMAEPPKKKCPKCQRNGLSRRISAGAGVIFKGSGFYETDYRRAAEKKPESDSGAGSQKDQGAAKEAPKTNKAAAAD